MRILIDGRMYGLEHAGIGRYVQNLVDNLRKIDKENSYTLFLRKKYFLELELPKNWRKILVDIPHYSIIEQVRLPSIIKAESPDLIHFPHFNTPVFYCGKYVVTIHDLIKHISRGMATTTHTPWFYWLKYLGYKIVFQQAIKRATKIIVPSMVVRRDLVRSYSLPEGKVTVTYEGVEDKFKALHSKREISEEILEKYGITRPFVIYTGSVYPHKNVERLIQAIKLVNIQHITYRMQQISLVISCARNVFWSRLENEIRELGAKDFVRLAGFVPDEDLIALYEQAEAFIFPTLSEGFGLPGLEAMACGLPVVCSDIAVLREIYGGAAVYFNPLDVADMADKIYKVISDQKVHSQLVEEGLKQAGKYSWRKTAVETRGVYNELA